MEAEGLVLDDAGFDFCEVLVKDFSHWGACNIGAFFRESAIGKITARVLAVGQDYVEVFAAFVDDCCQADDFRAGAENYQEFSLPSFLK